MGSLATFAVYTAASLMPYVGMRDPPAYDSDRDQSCSLMMEITI